MKSAEDRLREFQTQNNICLLYTSGVERCAHGTAGTSAGCEHTGKHPDPEAECECRQALQRLWDSVRKQAHP